VRSKRNRDRVIFFFARTLASSINLILSLGPHQPRTSRSSLVGSRSTDNNTDEMSYEYHHYPPQPPPPLQAQAHVQSPNHDRSLHPIYASQAMGSFPLPQHQYQQTLQQVWSPSSSPSGSYASSSMLPAHGVGNGKGTFVGSMASILPHHQGQFQQQAQIHVHQPSPDTSSSQVSITGNSSGSQLSVNGGAARSMSSVSPGYQAQYHPPSQEVKKPYTSPYQPGASVSSSSSQIGTNGNGNAVFDIWPQYQGQYFSQGQQVSPAASGQMLAVNSNGYGTGARTLNSISPQHRQQYGQQAQQLSPFPLSQMLAVNENGSGFGAGLMASVSPHHQGQYYQQKQRSSPGELGSQLSVNSGTGSRQTSIISPQHQSPSYQQIQQALGPPPAFALPRSNSASPARFMFLSNQQQGQYQSLYPQLQTHSGQGSGVQSASSPIDDNDVFTDVKAEVDEQTQQLWYWIEVVKVRLPTFCNIRPYQLTKSQLWTFHDANLSPSEASRLATLYISKLPSDLPIHSNPTAAHASIISTLLSESHSLLHHLTLTILFPLIHSWSSSPGFHIHMSQPSSQPRTRSKYQITPLRPPNDARSNRLAYWRLQASTPASFPDGRILTPLEKFTEVLDTILDRKWVYAVGDGGDKQVRAVRAKMQGYLMWKFVLSADVVFLELVLRLSAEAYDRERWREVYFPAVSCLSSFFHLYFLTLWKSFGCWIRFSGF